jgi:hypothetical protein
MLELQAHIICAEDGYIHIYAWDDTCYTCSIKLDMHRDH